MPAGRKTMEARPRPRARARLAHEPEPEPEKQAAADREGTRPAGQGADGKERKTRGPAADASATTSAAERRAKAARMWETWLRKERARKTRAEWMRRRVVASMPEAQPTNTGAAGLMRGSTEASAAAVAEQGRREPETPTTEAARRSCTSELGTDGGMAARWLMWMKETLPKGGNRGAEQPFSGGAQGTLRDLEDQDWQGWRGERGL